MDATLELALGGYPLDPGAPWNPGWDPEDIADFSDDVPGQPDVSTDE